MAETCFVSTSDLKPRRRERARQAVHRKLKSAQARGNRVVARFRAHSSSFSSPQPCVGRASSATSVTRSESESAASSQGTFSASSLKRQRSAVGRCRAGFAVTAEDPVTITVEEASIAEFSLPQEMLSFSPPESIVVQQYNNGDQERNIHCNTRLTVEELELLNQVKLLARQQGVSLTPSIAVQATRFLSLARCNPCRALELMVAAQAARETFFQQPIVDRDVAEDLNLGFLYICGRDPSLRPIMVVRPARLPQEWIQNNCVDRMLKVVLFQMEYLCKYMFYPGRVENVVLVVDFAGVGISQIPLTLMREIHKVLTYQYPCRLAKVYICNLSGAVKLCFGTAKKILSCRQQQRLIEVEVSKMSEVIAASQLEEDLGGVRPVLTTFFPFQLPAGPFEVATSRATEAGPVPPRVQNLHSAFTPQGLQGKLWDPRQSDEYNVHVETTAEAASLFERCGVPLPEPPPMPADLDNVDELQAEGDTLPSCELAVKSDSLRRRHNSKVSGMDWLARLAAFLCCA